MKKQLPELDGGTDRITGDGNALPTAPRGQLHQSQSCLNQIDPHRSRDLHFRLAQSIVQTLMSKDTSSDTDDLTPFTLFGSRLIDRLEGSFGLVRDGRRRMGPRVLVAVLISWVPLLLLAATQGLAIGPTRLESFLMDFAVNVRLLVVVPVFLLGEAIGGAQLGSVVQQFLDAGLVKDESRAQFDVTVRNTVRLSRSRWTDALLLSLAYLHSAAVLFALLFELQTSTWRVSVTDGHAVISLAGIWFFLVAFPLYSFLLWRWLLRIALWWRLLRQISRLDLRLTPSHKDGAGGLAFLSISLEAFAFFVFGAAALSAAEIADFVVYEGNSPLQYQWDIVGFVILLLILIAGPVLFFLRPLYVAREEAIFRYGALASRQIQQIEGKWFPKRSMPGDIELSMHDFYSITHLEHSVEAVHNMSLLPLTKEDVLQLVIIAVLPFIPVLATQVPMGEILSMLLKALA